MSLVGLIVLVLVLGLILTFIQRSGWIEQKYINVAYALLVFFLVVILLRHLGFWPGSVPDAKI